MRDRRFKVGDEVYYVNRDWTHEAGLPLGVLTSGIVCRIGRRGRIYVSHRQCETHIKYPMTSAEAFAHRLKGARKHADQAGG